MKSQAVSRRLLWPGLLTLLLLLLAVPANAGPQWKEPQSDTSTGDINPTSAPVVDDDFAGLELVAVKEEPTLLDTADLTVYTDKEMLVQINAAEAHQVGQGAGVVVAVLDAGFQLDHPAIASNLVPGGWDFVDDDPDPSDLGNGIDDDEDGWTDRGVGHGTTVALMVLSAAPKAGILPLRVRDDEGRGTDEPLLHAIEYAMKLGVDVINLSVDDDIYDQESLRWILWEAKSSGIMVVAAAGNDGLNYLPAQAIIDAHLVVGAVDYADTVASFSNYSDNYLASQMVFAPGVDLLGPMVVNGLYTRARWSGTSFAAGVVSGAAAIMREINPGWDPGDIQTAIVRSVVPVRLANGKKLRKVGRLDLANLVQR